MRNHSYENDFDLHKNETAYRTHFHMKSFALRIVLKQRHKRTRNWSIVMTNASFCLFICVFAFASNSGHLRINDFLLFFTPLLLLNYFLFN